MTESNLEIVRAIYSDLARGNLWSSAHLYAPDVSFEPIDPGGARGAARGPGGVAASMRDFLEQWSAFRVEAQEFFEVGDSIVVRERQHATGRASGIALSREFYGVWTFADGQIVRMRWETERDAAMAEAGRGPS